MLLLLSSRLRLFAKQDNVLVFKKLAYIRMNKFHLKAHTQV